MAKRLRRSKRPPYGFGKGPKPLYEAVVYASEDKNQARRALRTARRKWRKPTFIMDLDPRSKRWCVRVVTEVPVLRKIVIAMQTALQDKPHYMIIRVPLYPTTKNQDEEYLEHLLREFATDRARGAVAWMRNTGIEGFEIKPGEGTVTFE